MSPDGARMPLRILCTDDPWVKRSAEAVAAATGGTVITATAASLATSDADLLVVGGGDITHSLDQQYVRAAVLERQDPREALVTRQGESLADVARSKTATILVVSPTTRVQVVKRAPDVTVLPVVSSEAAFNAVMHGEASALIAPIAWLRVNSHAAPALVVRPLEHGELLHPVGCGLASVFCRRDDARARKAVAGLDNTAARSALTAERELLFHVTGDSPDTVFAVAGHAETRLTASGDERLVLLGLLMTSTGYGPYRASHEVGAVDATTLGRAMAATLLAQYQSANDRVATQNHTAAHTGH